MSHEVDIHYLLNLADLKYRKKKLSKEDQIIFNREHKRNRERKAKIEKMLEGMLWHPNIK